MRIDSGAIAWLSFCCLLVLVLVAGAGELPAPSAAAQDPCPAGQEPLPFISLAEIPLPEDVLPYSRVTLNRITVQPGETYDYTPDGYAAYYVESGILQYEEKPGFAISMAPKCTTPDGRYSASIRTKVDRKGFASVDQGKALISDVIPTGPISNGGDKPLVMLVMALVPPMIDPDTGQPIPDPVVEARAKVREREQRRRECREAREAIAEAALGTPVAQAGGEAVAELPEECRKGQRVQ